MLEIQEILYKISFDIEQRSVVELYLHVSGCLGFKRALNTLYTPYKQNPPITMYVI